MLSKYKIKNIVIVGVVTSFILVLLAQFFIYGAEADKPKDFDYVGSVANCEVYTKRAYTERLYIVKGLNCHISVN